MREGRRWFCGKRKHEDQGSDHRSHGNKCTLVHITVAARLLGGAKRIAGGFVDSSLPALGVGETLSQGNIVESDREGYSMSASR